MPFSWLTMLGLGLEELWFVVVQVRMRVLRGVADVDHAADALGGGGRVSWRGA